MQYVREQDPLLLRREQAYLGVLVDDLITNPKVVFADEPTGALDQSTGAEVMGVLTYACQSTGASLILVTHDPSVAARLPHEIHMRDGLIDQQVSR